MKNIKLSRQAEKFLLQADDKTRDRIIEGIAGLKEQPQKGDIKKLQDRKDELRLRIGKHRVIFINFPARVYIVRVALRSKAY